jgi:hypothetical protein
MTKTGGNEPKTGGAGGRERRLAAALRENLQRRKAQARGRATQPPPRSGPPKGDKSG